MKHSNITVWQQIMNVNQSTLLVWHPKIQHQHNSHQKRYLYACIAGLVGTGIATEFRTWTKIYQDLPNLADIFDGKTPPLPTAPDTLYALASAMTAYAKDHKKELDRIANSIMYAEKFPPDFSAMLLKDYLYIEEGYREKLLKIPAFSRWLSTKGRLLNGITWG